jgi:hypothetical protein
LEPRKNDFLDAMRMGKINLADIRPIGKSLIVAGRRMGKTSMTHAWFDEWYGIKEKAPVKCIFIPINGRRGIILDIEDLDVFDTAYIVDGDPELGKLRRLSDPIDIRIVDLSRIEEALPDPVEQQKKRDQHRAKLMEELAQLDEEDLKI